MCQDVPTQAHADKCESLKALTVMEALEKEEVPVPAPRYHQYHGQIPEKMSLSGQNTHHRRVKLIRFQRHGNRPGGESA